MHTDAAAGSPARPTPKDEIRAHYDGSWGG